MDKFKKSIVGIDIRSTSPVDLTIWGKGKAKDLKKEVEE